MQILILVHSLDEVEYLKQVRKYKNAFSYIATTYNKWLSHPEKV